VCGGAQEGRFLYRALGDMAPGAGVGSGPLPARATHVDRPRAARSLAGAYSPRSVSSRRRDRRATSVCRHEGRSHASTTRDRASGCT
jgi:hypothetical protein